MKNVLLLVHDDAGQEARYQGALDVTRQLGGHLTCVDVAMVPELIGDAVALVDGGVMLAEERTREATNKARMLARLESEGVPFDWIDHVGFVRETIKDHAGLADLIVLSADAEGEIFPWMKEVVGDLLVELGKPVLMMPPNVLSFRPQGKAMIAWDGSADAAAALQASIPILQHASSVTLVYANDKSLKVPLEEAACYLSRHDIEPQIKQLPVGIERPGRMLCVEAELGRYDYAVMGGYGHSRTIETIFGGVTRTMLEKSRIPILLVHKR
ncbi:universal stress protein [Sphingomonas sp. MMS24-J13]|uniref:universal stress protein n=1 Tax=Sphingomonas sp. MMS24-J13 TaxID=3238686 RepID=UPI00384B755C